MTRSAATWFTAAVVATAPKLTGLAWHLAASDEDCPFARPGLAARKQPAGAWALRRRWH